MWNVLNILFLLLIAIVLICFWVMIYDSNRFVVREYTFGDSRIRKDCRAVVLADLHNKKYGRNNALLLETISAAKPDMILVAGDILTARPGERLDVALQLMEDLAKDYPIYYGNGNHEQRLKLYPAVYGDMAQRYEEGLSSLGIKPLVNAHAELLEYGIVIYGVELDRKYYKRFGGTQMAEDYLPSVLGRVDKSAYNILLAHNPAYFPRYAGWGADLTLAGHIHGGMVRLPFWGKGIISPEVKLFPRYDGGEFEESGHVMLVSRGLGMHTIPIRLFNPAELLVVDFRAEG